MKAEDQVKVSRKESNKKQGKKAVPAAKGYVNAEQTGESIAYGLASEGADKGASKETDSYLGVSKKSIDAKEYAHSHMSKTKAELKTKE